MAQEPSPRRDPMERLRKTPADIVRLMEPIPLFDELTLREKAILAELCEVVRCAAQTRVFEAGEEGRNLYVVLQGRLELRTVVSAGLTHGVREIPAGRLAGLDAVLLQSPYHLQCVALENTAALRFQTHQLHQLLASGTPAAVKLFVAMRAELGMEIRAATLQVVQLLEATSAMGSQVPVQNFGTPVSNLNIQTLAIPGGNQSRGS